MYKKSSERALIHQHFEFSVLSEFVVILSSYQLHLFLAFCTHFIVLGVICICLKLTIIMKKKTEKKLLLNE